MITRILVANRGEIARRVFATCATLGIDTVAIYSDADEGMPFVADADVAVRLPGNTPAQTYLRTDLVIEAALRTGADAIHPGYGFLAENADAARAVRAAGLIWIGPDPEAIESMGSKIEAKVLMRAAGVPILEDLSVDEVTDDHLPVIVKASAGGGGRGMRVVHSLGQLAAEVQAASAEAASTFGEGAVFLEQYLSTGRHVEVQVLGTADGVLVFGERDCSIQRRHQKVIEEAPAPALPEATRAALHEAARAAAASIGYLGAGTVEFLYDPQRDRFFFLEMNTRLQVEHPVTEAIFGVDLVAAQIAVADGRAVAGPVAPRGHAVQVRLYAEDPAAGYQPQTGVVSRLEIPNVAATFGNPSGWGIRLDAGVESGSQVGVFYDAMLAKVIAWAPTRDEALRLLAATLSRAQIHGVGTNRDLLVALLRDPVLVSAQMHTTYLDSLDIATFGVAPLSDRDLALAAFAATVEVIARGRASATAQARIPAGFRNVLSGPQVNRFTHRGDPVEVRWFGGAAMRPAELDDVAVLVHEPGSAGSAGSAAAPGRVVLDDAGLRRTFTVWVSGDAVEVHTASGQISLTRVPRFADAADAAASGSLHAPMPGSIVAVLAQPGQVVATGDGILILEAMKMQHTVSAPHAGTVAEILVAVGAQVDAGTVLAVIHDTTEGDAS